MRAMDCITGASSSLAWNGAEAVDDVAEVVVDDGVEVAHPIGKVVLLVVTRPIKVMTHVVVDVA